MERWKWKFDIIIIIHKNSHYTFFYVVTYSLYHPLIFCQVMYMYYLLGHRLMELPISVDRKALIAQNTYILALDGDIDFQPPAVLILVDLMKKNQNLGAACGRIHPVGSGKSQAQVTL